MSTLDLIINKMCDSSDYKRWENQISKTARESQEKTLESLAIDSRLQSYFNKIKQISYNQKKYILLAEDNSFISNIPEWQKLHEEEFIFLMKEMSNSDMINYSPSKSSFFEFKEPKILNPIQITDSLSIRPIINSTILSLVSLNLNLSTFNTKSIICDHVQKYFIFKNNDPIAVISFYITYNAFSIFAKNNSSLPKNEFNQIKNNLINLNILDTNSLQITNRDEYFIAISNNGSNINNPQTALDHRFLEVYNSKLKG